MSILFYWIVLTDPKATLPPPTVSSPRQPFLPDADSRLGLLSPHTPSISHEVDPQLPPETPPPPVVSQSHQRSLPNIDPRLDSLPPRTAISQIDVRPRRTVPPTRLPPLPPPEANPGSETSESDSEELDVELAQDHEPEIDERSDDEDDRAAHELLRAAPVTTPAVPSNPPVLSYGHQGFSVSPFLHSKPHLTLPPCLVGIWQRQLSSPGALCTESRTKGPETIACSPCPIQLFDIVTVDRWRPWRPWRP